MNGVFCKRRFLAVQNVLGLISGVVLALLFGAFLCIGEFTALDDVLLSLFFVAFGLAIAALCCISLYINRKAYIQVESMHISALCHIGLSLECSLSDVKSVSYGGTGLCIQLHNGKKYHLMNLENAIAVGRYIQRQISAKPEESALGREELEVQIPIVKKKSKTMGIAAIIVFLLLFPEIFLSSAITGWKELHQFTGPEWIAFGIMAGVGILTVAVFCVLLRKYLQHVEKLHKLQGAISQLILRTEPLQPGNAVKMFIDDIFDASYRVTVYGYPDSRKAYFIVEQVDASYKIQCIHRSQVYPDVAALLPELADMTEIELPKN